MFTDQLLLDLKVAREYLNAHKWIQGDNVPRPDLIWEGQPCCANAALWIAIVPGFPHSVASYPDPTDRVHNASGYLEYAAGYALITAFNDKPGRTKEEVLAVYDKAIARRIGELEESM